MCDLQIDFISVYQTRSAIVSQYIGICAVEELMPGQRCLVEVSEDDEVLVLNIDGAHYAIDNVCPHAGAALERGTVVDGVLFCPLHHWGFCLSTGQVIDGGGLYTRTYRVVTRGERLYLILD
jgi:nitrite reductase/ring-hydroxylating ferredoxin subunit